MKIEFEYSIRRSSFLCHLTDIKIAWINPWMCFWQQYSCTSLYNIIWSLKICIIRIFETYLYGQTRNAQTISKKIATFVHISLEILNQHLFEYCINNLTSFIHNSLTHTKYRCYCQLLLIVITVVNKKMLNVSLPFINNLFENVNLLFLILYMVGNINFSSILIKKHTFGHI